MSKFKISRIAFKSLLTYTALLFIFAVTMCIIGYRGFTEVLLRMYTRYAERHRWKTELIDLNDTGLGGVKEAVMMIKGKGAYSRLKYESGVHRVQRVPETESSGRIHTSPQQQIFTL